MCIFSSLFGAFSACNEECYVERWGWETAVTKKCANIRLEPYQSLSSFTIAHWRNDGYHYHISVLPYIVSPQSRILTVNSASPLLNSLDSKWTCLTGIYSKTSSTSTSKWCRYRTKNNKNKSEAHTHFVFRTQFDLLTWRPWERLQVWSSSSQEQNRSGRASPPRPKRPVTQGTRLVVINARLIRIHIELLERNLIVAVAWNSVRTLVEKENANWCICTTNSLLLSSLFKLRRTIWHITRCRCLRSLLSRGTKSHAEGFFF